jgi:DNA-binding response OmpR family regulator
VFPARILLLDDSDLLRCAVRSVLQKAGYDVIEGENGREGLACLLEKTPIDLVLSDWMMFDMDGEALLAEMREQKILTPALLMTGRADPEIGP